MKHRHESPSVNILLTIELLSLYPVSWDTDCLLTLWPLLIPCSLDNSGCVFGFLIFIIVERNSLCNSLYILTERSLKHPCSTKGLGPRVFLPLSLSPSPSLSSSLWLILWSIVICQAHSAAQAFKTSSRGRPVPSWVVQVLFHGFIGSLREPGNISFFLSFTVLFSTPDHQVLVH